MYRCIDVLKTTEANSLYLEIKKILGPLSAAHFVSSVVIVLMFALVCMWCISYKKLLTRFDKKNQKFSPNLAFLLLMPIIGLFWWGCLAFCVKNNLRITSEKKLFDNYEDGRFVLVGLDSSFCILFAVTAFVLWVFSWAQIVKTRKLFRVKFFIASYSNHKKIEQKSAYKFRHSCGININSEK